MSRTTYEVNLAADVAAAGTFAVPYETESQADFVDGQTVSLNVYGALHECAVTFGATEATVTWPAGKSYPLPAGEYYIDFDLVGGDTLDGDAAAAANQADSTEASGIIDNSGGTADNTIQAVPSDTLINNAAAANNNFADVVARLRAVETQHNALLAKLKSAGLMEPDA